MSFHIAAAIADIGEGRARMMAWGPQVDLSRGVSVTSIESFAKFAQDLDEILQQLHLARGGDLAQQRDVATLAIKSISTSLIAYTGNNEPYDTISKSLDGKVMAELRASIAFLRRAVKELQKIS